MTPNQLIKWFHKWYKWALHLTFTKGREKMTKKFPVAYLTVVILPTFRSPWSHVFVFHCESNLCTSDFFSMWNIERTLCSDLFFSPLSASERMFQWFCVLGCPLKSRHLELSLILFCSLCTCLGIFKDVIYSVHRSYLWKWLWCMTWLWHRYLLPRQAGITFVWAFYLFLSFCLQVEMEAGTVVGLSPCFVF